MKKVSIEINGRTLSIESGRMAKQANGSVWIQYGETAVLTTAVTGKSNRDDIDFFPLSVDYQEKFASAGKIPGGFFKREGRQSEREILISRLTDRPIRPLFPKGFQRETQIISTVFSFDKVNESDILSVLGASAALHISDIPFMGPIAAVRVGRVDGELVCNPTLAQMENAELDMVVAGSRDAIVMVEGEASQLPESVVLEALQLAHKQIQPLLDLQDELKKALGKEKIQVQTPEERISDFQTLVTERALPKIREAFGIKEKIARYQQIETFQKELIDALAEENEEYADRGKEIKGIVHDLIGQEIRKDIVENGRRMDDRSPETIREITGEVGVLPRAHGSALFTRGETQALVSATLGTSDDEQRMDSLMGESTRRFLLHYNFPAFCVGEVKPMRGPARREIGHGALAHKALMQVVPSKEEFPYSIRVVSDVLESHGSSSMATVCGGSMALMDAGVPLKAPVAGIAMGLIKEGDQFFVLSDITGDEDHVGDMDFKVAGTQTGVTAVQMDIKVTGISWDVVEKALEQAKQGRLHILGKMAQALPESRQQLSQHAPRLESFEIPKDKIREVIGTGGKVIRGIIEETGAKVE
ncbi:MAG: polyribonucleotide nucleotidyltransferase, partial [Bdellovibrionales bacterium]|nr:polyribonucleotide nucleotidyltransferase [Bdellovibrionales bacterium]